MKNRRFSKSAWGDFDSGGDINPMEGVANLADVMLVLAVGIMMALIAAWDIDVVNSVPNAQQVTVDDAVELEEELDSLAGEDSEDGKPFDEYGLTEYGKVYQDADGNLYMLSE